MTKHSLATVVNFCSNEAAFLKPCLTEALKFSSRICVCLADHFFDGEKENFQKLFHLFKNYPRVDFLLYPFIPGKVRKLKIYRQTGDANFWHSLCRLIGFSRCSFTTEYTLFLDVDEIVDGCLFKKWLDNFDYQKYNALRPANYWYFRESRYRAETVEDSAVMVKNSKVRLSSLLKKSEREAIFEEMEEPKIRKVLFADKPLIHHYSWVRTQEQMLKKIKSWGHKNDRPWSALIKKEFAGPFQGKDFVHGYRFEEVRPFCRINLQEEVAQVSRQTGQASPAAPAKSSRINFFTMKDVMSLLKKL